MYVYIILLNLNNVYIICTKNLILVNGAKFYPIISTVKFHTPFEEKTIVPNSYVVIYFKYIYISIK